MVATRIRPVSDLRNKYSDVEAEIKTGPVCLTKNGYSASVLVSPEFFDRTMAKVALYERIARLERDFAAGRCQNARDALQELRSEFDV